MADKIFKKDYTKQFQRLAELKAANDLGHEYNQIREQLVIDNYDLVDWCLEKYFSDTEIPQDEVRMYALEGLVIAINNFTYQKGFTFASYAIRAIKHNIQNHFKEMMGINWQNYLQKASLAEPITSQVIETDDYYLTDSKCQMPMTLEDYEEIDNYEDANSQGFEEDYAAIVDYHLLQKEVKKAMISLPEKEQIVLNLIFGLNDNPPLSMEDTARKLNISYDTVRQILAKGLRHLRHPLNTRRLKPFYEDGETKGNREILVNINFHNQIFIYLINLIKNHLSFSSMLEFINMNFNIKWTKEDLIKAIDILNQLAVMINDKVNKDQSMSSIIQELNESSLYPVVFNNKYYTWLSGFSSQLVNAIINDYEIVDLEQMKKM